jgi:predicted HTH transcriptional regulator
MNPLAILVALAFGFFLGRSFGKKKDDTPTFSDPDFAEEAAEKGRHTIEARTEKRKSRILAQAQSKGQITNDDVEELFCISDATARNYLNELEVEGKLTQVGDTGRGVYYKPVT